MGFFLLLKVSFLLFLLGSLGMFSLSKNMLILLICMELMLIGINFGFIIYSVYLEDLLGQLFSLFILTIAASESSMGLAMVIAYYRLGSFLSESFMFFLKG